MRSFTIEVYRCDQCPHADTYDQTCIRYLNQQYEVNGECTEDDEGVSRKIYQENCMELCDSCPNLQ